MSSATSTSTQCDSPAPASGAASAGWHPAASAARIHALSGVVLRELWRRKDFYVLFALTALITLLLGSVNVFNQQGIVRYLKEICLFLIWASSLVIAITMTARQIPSERENRTLFPLLAKPITRWEVVMGKFWGCWLAAGFSTLVFYMFLVILSGAREHQWPLLSYLQAWTLHWAMLGIVIAMAMLGSLVFAAPSSTNTILFIVVAGILLLGRHLNKVALQMGEPGQTVVYWVYYLIPHLEFFDLRDLLVHNWPPVSWLIWAAALGYAAIYTAVFLLAACIRFRRQSLS